MSVLFIHGSSNFKSRTTSVISHFKNTYKNNGIKTQLVTPADIPANDLIHYQFQSNSIIQFQKAVSDSEIIVISTPIYQGSFAGTLKLLLDLIPQKGLSNKIIIPVATGGSIAHLLAIEYALNPVLSNIGAETILPGIYGTNQDFIDQQTHYEIQNISLTQRIEQTVQRSLAYLPAFA